MLTINVRIGLLAKYVSMKQSLIHIRIKDCFPPLAPFPIAIGTPKGDPTLLKLSGGSHLDRDGRSRGIEKNS
jgi:hypothetical protein